MLKAFGTAWQAAWIEAGEILNDDKGKPYVVLSEMPEIYGALGGKSIDISLSHCGGAVAYAVIEAQGE